MNTTQTAVRPAHPELPAFIAERVAAFQSDKYRADRSAHSVVMGPAPAPGDIDLKSNDYLSLGRHPEVIDAQVAELRRSGSEQMMSAFFLNGKSRQWALENALAELMGSEAAVLFQSGYQANTGLLQTLVEPGGFVYLDQRAHASLYQGAAAGGGALRLFRHNDADHLRRQVNATGPGVVAIDSVYSTDGSIAPIAEIADAAAELGCALIVDESHSLGTHGPRGAGLVAALGLESRVHMRTASLAKAFCGRAGVVACSQRCADYLRFASFPNIFSSCVLPHEIAALATTLQVIERDDWRRAALHRNAARVRAGLDALGYNVSASASQIVALEAGNEDSAVRLALALQARGVHGAIFFSPATPKNRACVRLSVNAALTDRDIARILQVCAEIRDEVALADWPSTRRRHADDNREAPRACHGVRLPSSGRLRTQRRPARDALGSGPAQRASEGGNAPSPHARVHRC